MLRDVLNGVRDGQTFRSSNLKVPNLGCIVGSTVFGPRSIVFEIRMHTLCAISKFSSADTGLCHTMVCVSPHGLRSRL